jgi:hypothetical protein
MCCMRMWRRLPPLGLSLKGAAREWALERLLVCKRFSDQLCPSLRILGDLDALVGGERDPAEVRLDIARPVYASTAT